MRWIVDTTVLVGLLTTTASSECGVSRVDKIVGGALAWESISLDVDERAFKKTAVQLVGASDSEAVTEIACQGQTSLSVPDLEKKNY